jgi:hypothetical protein
MWRTRYSFRILMKIEFSGLIFKKKKKSQISCFIKIRPVGDELHADRQTDMTKLIVAFSRLWERA